MQEHSFSGAIGLDLKQKWFMHSHLYAAISKTTKSLSMHLLIAKADDRMTSEVYRTVMSTT